MCPGALRGCLSGIRSVQLNPVPSERRYEPVFSSLKQGLFFNTVAIPSPFEISQVLAQSQSSVIFAEMSHPGMSVRHVMTTMLT